MQTVLTTTIKNQGEVLNRDKGKRIKRRVAEMWKKVSIFKYPKVLLFLGFC